MTSPVLRSVLVQDVRTHIGWESPDTTATQAEIERLVDQAAKRLYNALIQSRGADYYLTSIGFTTDGRAVPVYPLPADFYRLQDVRVQVGGLWYSMAHFDRHKWAEYQNYVQVGAFFRAPYAYNLRGKQRTIAAGPPFSDAFFVDQIEIQPTPQAGIPISLDYVPTTAALVDGGDVVYNGVNGFEEWIVCDCCAALVAKEQDDPSFWLARKAEVDAMVKMCGAARDEGRAQTVQDVLGREGDLYTPGRRLPW